MTTYHDQSGGPASDLEARLRADLAFDPGCTLRDEPGHVCLRRDGRSVGILGEAGDCHASASSEAYVASRERHPSHSQWTESDEIDLAYLMQQSALDAEEAAQQASDDAEAPMDRKAAGQ